MTATITETAAWPYPAYRCSSLTTLDANEQAVEDLLHSACEDGPMRPDVALHLIGLLTHRTPERAAELVEHLLDLAAAVNAAEDCGRDAWRAAVDDYEGTLHVATRSIDALLADWDAALAIVAPVPDELTARRTR
jgi:hypothetical protein